MRMNIGGLLFSRSTRVKRAYRSTNEKSIMGVTPERRIYRSVDRAFRDNYGAQRDTENGFPFEIEEE